MAIREGRWDCSSCGSTGIYGRHVTCPGCGKSRPASVRFYLAAGEPEVKDPDRLKEAWAGPDWICGGCGATHRAGTPICTACGTMQGSRRQRVTEHTLEDTPRPPEPRGEKKSRPSAPPAAPSFFAGSPGPGGSAASPASGGSAASPESGGSGGSGGSVDPSGAPPSPLTPGLAGTRGPEKRPRLPNVFFAGVGMLLLVVIASIAMSGPRTRMVPGTVEAAVWERTIWVKTRSLEPGEGWELPDSAVDVVRSERPRGERQQLEGYRTVTRYVPRTVQVLQGYRQEIRTVQVAEDYGTRTELCGTRNLGNGYFEDVKCEVPDIRLVDRPDTVQAPVYTQVTRIDTVTEQQPVYRTVPAMATWYSYRLPTWTTTDTLRLAGTSMNEPVWPDTAFGPGRRESGRMQDYYLVVRDARGERTRLTFMLWPEVWAQYRAGDRVMFRGNYSSGRRIIHADSTRACRRWHAGRTRHPPDGLGCSPRRR
jgi:hypothetical protein